MKRNRLFALVLASTMLWSTVGAKDVQSAEPENNSLLAEFTFDNEDSGFSGGRAKAEGEYTLVESYDSSAGNALHLDGTDRQWLNVTDLEGRSLLTGVEEMTVSYDIKNERESTNWALYAAQRAGSWVAGQEHYIGFLHNGGRLSVERYDNTNGRPQNPSAEVGQEWTHVDAVFSSTDTTIYINGVEQSRVESAYPISALLGENSILQIGKADWETVNIQKLQLIM